jgi:hypothetical protein
VLGYVAQKLHSSRAELDVLSFSVRTGWGKGGEYRVKVIRISSTLLDECTLASSHPIIIVVSRQPIAVSSKPSIRCIRLCYYIIRLFFLCSLVRWTCFFSFWLIATGGGGIGGDIRAWVLLATNRIHFESSLHHTLQRTQPEVFYFGLLPPLIFKAGYTCRRKAFFQNIVPITLFAVVGTFVSTFFIGYATYALGRTGWVEIDVSTPIESLLLGALISAVSER